MRELLRALMVIILLGGLVLAGWLAYLWLSETSPTVEVNLLPEIPLLPQPTPTIYPSPGMVVQRVQTLSRLETASYVIEKVITAETGQGPLGFLFGDKLLLVAHGEVIAGVDLSRLDEDRVHVTDEGTLYLLLPPAEVFVATLDNERSYVHDRRTGVVGQNVDLETAARREAELRILEAALEDGVLQKADENARDFLEALFLGFGFERVDFDGPLPTPTPIIPTPLPMITVAPLP